MSIDNQLSPFERMPTLVIGNVLDQLNQMIGSKEIINESDIPVIIRNFINLSLTSKTMALNLADLGVTKIFLNSLSEKYRKPQEYFASIFHTKGTHEWLWSYIRNNEYDRDYQSIQDIYELAANVLQEAKDAGLNFNLEEGRKSSPKPNPYYYQTKQGFALYNGWHPNHLATPFGEIQIYKESSCSGNSLSVAEVFIKRLNCVFLRLCQNYGKTYEIVTSSELNTIRKIRFNIKDMKLPKEELDKRIGTQNIIMNDRCGNYAIYAIREVKGKKIPDLKFYDKRKQFLRPELVNKMWKMLEENDLTVL